MAGTPQRFTPRAGSGLPGRVRRSLDGGVESTQRYAKERGVEVGTDGRAGVVLARNSGLMMTRDGLMLDKQVIGDKNRAEMDRIADIEAAPTAAELATKLNELLAELRRTKRLRGV